MSNAKYIAILIVVGIILIIGAVLLGKSDNGQIDVNKAIESSNQANIEAGNTDATVNTTPANLRNLPNGGLVPQDPNNTNPAPEPEPEVEDENASSTEEEGGEEPDADAETEEVSEEEQTTETAE